MARSRTALRVDLPLAEAHAVCVAGIIGMGWRSANEGPRRIAAQELAGDEVSGANPARIVVCLEPAGSAKTEAVVNGASFGSDSIAQGHVRGRVACLARTIRTGVARAVSASADGRACCQRNVQINGVRISNALVAAFEREYQTAIPDGSYWYDPVCGAWGVEGGPVGGFVQPGLDLGGPLAADASRGTSGILVNGRELGVGDLQGMWQDLAIGPGRYWLNARGDFGLAHGTRITSFSRLPGAVFMLQAVTMPIFAGATATTCFPAARPCSPTVKEYRHPIDAAPGADPGPELPPFGV